MLHTQPVFVTTHRRQLVTDAVLTIRCKCADVGVEMVDFDIDTNHDHPLASNPFTPPISTPVRELNGRTAPQGRQEFTGD